MARYVEILSRRTVFDQFFKIEEAQLRHEMPDGRLTPPLTRLVFERGDSVAALVHDVSADTLILTEQFRYPTLAQDGGWLLEIPAGSLEAGETPEACLRRELEEEIGYTIGAVQFISTFYVSPGGSSERIHLYYVRVTPQAKSGAGGGHSGEGEHITLVTLPLVEAFQRAAAGGIPDAKSLIGLLWLQLQRAQPG